jgi:hypothetical protein
VFIEGFDPDSLAPHSEVPWDKSSQAGFEEGNTWQYTWMIPHNYRGLFDAIGGDAEVTRRLDKFFSRLVSWGYPNFNIGNEPSFVAPYAYSFAGAPWATQKTVRRIMTEIFKTKPGGLPGNDDLGATSGWYVWSALGLYPAIPGIGGFVISSPLFPVSTIELSDGRRLRIEADGASESQIYIQSLSVNGKPYSKSWLPLSLIGKGTNVLKFKLDNAPNTSWATATSQAPPSFNEGQSPILFFIRGDDSVTLSPGQDLNLTLAARRISDGPLVINWNASTTAGDLQVSPASGRMSLEGHEEPHLNLKIISGPKLTTGSYLVRIRMQVASQNAAERVLPDLVAEIKVDSQR